MLLCSTLAQDITQSDTVVNIEENVDNNEQKEIKQRQGPQQPGWGGLISGKEFFCESFHSCQLVNDFHE